MKIGIIGNTNYENLTMIKNKIVELKNQYGDDLMIFSGGEDNVAEHTIKDFSQYNSVFYFEFTPKYNKRNSLSFMDVWYYTKNKPSKKSSRWYLDRYYKLIDNSEKVIIFGDSEYNATFEKRCNTKSIPYTIIT